MRLLAGHSTSEGLLFSATFVGAVIGIISALYLVDVAAVRVLLALP
jgi:hypothetical protein